jgi:hypothetical protein
VVKIEAERDAVERKSQAENARLDEAEGHTGDRSSPGERVALHQAEQK